MIEVVVCVRPNIACSDPRGTAVFSGLQLVLDVRRAASLFNTPFLVEVQSSAART
jgi:hypothetical protein